MNHFDAGSSHRQRQYRVKNIAPKHLLVCLFLAGRVLIGDHNEPGVLVVVFVVIQNAVEMRKLPREDVCRE